MTQEDLKKSDAGKQKEQDQLAKKEEFSADLVTIVGVTSRMLFSNQPNARDQGVSPC